MEGNQPLQQHPLLPPLRLIIEELAAPNASEMVVKAAGARLRHLIDEEGDSMLHRMNAVNAQNKVLANFIQSQLEALLAKPETRIGGIIAVEAFRDVEFVDVAVRLQMLHQMLTKVIHDASATSREAARVWGLVMDSPHGTASDLIGQQLTKCIEALFSGDNLSATRRFIGSLMLQQVAPRVSPNAMMSRLDDVMRGIWGALRDPLDHTRQAAAAALRKVLDVVAHSADPGIAEPCFDQLVQMCLKCVSSYQKQREVAHGGLLAMNAWLGACVCSQRAAMCQMLSTARQNEVYSTVVLLLQKPSTFADIRQETIACIPLLAQYNKTRFVEVCLTDFVVWAGNCYRNTSGPDERGPMFLAIGQLASVLPDKVPTFAERVVGFIEGSLTKKPKRDRCPEALSCFAMIAASDPKTARVYLRSLMGPAFACTPTVDFARDIASICKTFPEIRSQCMERLLDATRQQLCAVKTRSAMNFSHSEADTQTILNGLQVLESLDFSGYSALSFLTDVVCRFTQDPHEVVRRSAIGLCFQLVHSGCYAPGSPCKANDQGTMVHCGLQHMRLVLSVIRSLINTAVADPESDIRLSTLERLTEAYDDTLGLQDCIRALFPALNDKHQNRLAAVRLLGRLAKRNPATVLPMLRRVLLQCFTEIQYFTKTKKQEQSTWVLSEVIAAAPSVAAPYISALLSDAVERLKDDTLPPQVQTALLSCVGRMVRFTDGADLSVVKAVRFTVMTHILDGSYAPKKQEAIRTLAEIVRATRDCSVYEQHPELLRVLLSALHGGFKEPWPMRQDVLKLMGVIGAVDPSKVKQLLRLENLGSGGRPNPNPMTSGQPKVGGQHTNQQVSHQQHHHAEVMVLSRLRSEEAAAHTTLRAIMDVLESPSTQDEQCLFAVQGLVQVCVSRDMQLQSIIAFFPKVIPAVIRSIDDHTRLRDKLFRELTLLITVAKHHIRGHLDDILNCVKPYLIGTGEPEVLAQILILLAELRRSLNEEFKPYLRLLLPALVQSATEDAARNADHVFECCVQFGKLMDGHLHLVLPCIVEIASSLSTKHKTRMSAVAAMTSFAKHLTSLADHAALCVHCLCRMLQEPQRGTVAAEKDDRDHLAHTAQTALLAIAQNLGPGFQKFDPTVRPIVSQRFGESSNVFQTYRSVIEDVMRSRARIIAPEPPRPIDGDPSRLYTNGTSSSGGRRGAPSDPAARFQDVRNILLPVERTGEDEWKLWLRAFSMELLRSSPCQAHSAALPLARIHDPFARQLFHPAFAACYGEMDETLRQEVVSLLTNILRNPRLPSEVLQELLNLSEFMERCEGASTGSNGSSATTLAVTSNSGQGGGSRGSNMSLRSTTGGLFDIKTIMDRSERCSLYAKALHYLEVLFTDLTREYEKSLSRGRVTPLTSDSVQQLLGAAEKSIYLCNLLGQRESANGILKYVQDNFAAMTGAHAPMGGSTGSPLNVSTSSPMLSAGGVASTTQHHAGGFSVLDAELLEKLQWWSQSLRAYQERLKADPNSVHDMRGVLVALDAQGEYPKLLETYKVFSRRVGRKESVPLAPMAARAAWVLQNWDDMEQITQLIRSDGMMGTTATFYNAVIAVQKRDFRAARIHIQKTLKELDGALAPLVAESYDRAYDIFVGNQQVVELEEVMSAIREGPSSFPRWRELWERRLSKMAYEGWQGTLATHSLVLPYQEELSMWIQFTSLCRSNGRERISTEVLNKLLGGRKLADAVSDIANPPRPRVTLAALTHNFEVGRQTQALQLLQEYVKKNEERFSGSQSSSDDVVDFAMCHAKVGEWMATLHAGEIAFNESLTQTVLGNLKRATELDAANGSTWHSWARMHHDITLKTTRHRPAALDTHVASALDGYLRSICLQEHLQDVLGFLSLWFAYGHSPAVEQSGVVKRMLQVNPNVWLRVIPQIIARIHTNHNPALNEQVCALLCAIAKAHPQALLYSLTVTSGVGVGGGPISNSGSPSPEILERRKAAQRVLARMMELHHHGAQLVSEASVVCHELVRCAVLWTELWYDELDRAWYSWGREKDPQAVLRILEPLLKLLEQPKTLAEANFQQEFGAYLDSGAAIIRDAASTGSQRMDEAWNIFKSIIEKIDQQVNSMSTLTMQLVSPLLLQSGRNLQLAVPGQYHESGDFPRIASFNATMKVMSSKQHPRRISINGSNGQIYKFLLKGHEDLRLDERVMQLLGLVNTVLSSSAATSGNDCLVQTYSVTPLSENAGLVGWVDHCDTLHQIIKDHRVHGKQLSAELNLMRGFSDDLARLTVIQHVEPFEYALENTEGTDLARSLWVRAPSAEIWLDRRTTYVRTLATMSMVGHVLGLGDRHPSNLMLHNFTGRVVHIDFGDCFEVAQQRSAFPERVPFRLTRMLIKAMEMGGIEGLFRHGCVAVMGVLREERGSLLAMLEAFLHDPLISWWRDDDDAGGNKQTAGTSRTGESYQGSLQRPISTHRDGVDVGSFASMTERSMRRRTMSSVVRGAGGAAGGESKQQQTKKAQKVLDRIKEKLHGREFAAIERIRCGDEASRDSLPVEDQVSRLIYEATSNENLCQHFSGWCPFW